MGRMPGPMAMWRRLLLLAMVAALPGCNDQKTVQAPPVRIPHVIALSDEGAYLPPPAGPGVVASLDSLIPDVPMPVGFKPVASKCQSSFDGTARQVRHVYQGRSRGAEVVRFYQQQLTRNDWRPVGRQQEDGGAVVLSYAKGPEALRVRVHEGWAGVVTIGISIFAQGASGPVFASPGPPTTP